MKPITIVIEGSFWDSQIYSGELMLLGDDGSIVRIDWSNAIDEFANQHSALQTAMRVAFADSDWLYNPQTKRLLEDLSIRSVVVNQLQELSELPARKISPYDWEKFRTTEDSPFSSLPTDTDIYQNKIYAALDDGLFSVPRTGSKLFQKLEKHHDASYLQVRASDGYKSVAGAAGSDGLFEFSIDNEEGGLGHRAKQLTKKPCSACDWAFHSVVAWGAGSAYFASFTKEQDKRSTKISRTPGSVFEFEKLFEKIKYDAVDSMRPIESSHFSWGSREKLYRAVQGAIEVSDYFGNGWIKKPSIKIDSEALKAHPFTWRGTIPTEIIPKNIIATGTAPFGTIIEEEDKITVIRSDGVAHVFSGELVHWRVFPRSKDYTNQLHLIYEDRLEIVSFVHDYFENQIEKLAGFSRK